MPVTARKNQLYAVALALAGRRCRWKHAEAVGGDLRTLARVERVWKKHRAVGGCVQMIRGGHLAETYTAGYASLYPPRPVRPDAVFRTASIAKAVCALLVMRLQTLGKLSVEEDVSALWHGAIRNPRHPETAIPLGSLLSHTSGIIDSPLYFRSFAEDITADTLLKDGASYTDALPYERFRYSNFAAGLVGSLLEHRFRTSFEDLIQAELFGPLGVRATFAVTRADETAVADGYRVLPPKRTPTFDARARFAASEPIGAPDPQRHFLLASGNLYITAGEMAKLCLAMMNGAGGLIDEKSLENLRTTGRGGAAHWQGMRHGMGLFRLEDESVLPRRLYGHQGFAYGAVNGFFFDEQGNGFVSFSSGASERRAGRLSLMNRDLIRALLLEL